ncbi:B-BOX ZINC FINGER PROTEIN 18 [Salix koriyanagi]|uniref:B-BOX ZINC FINGER PROTEIN 18 n=1 Tax=Salix koriyanagi TaxID=2511006 RepID=A0A9Q1AM62_9ROSI|nr:B-BOX ZINC FINGER PROTEIN 18 [Salix koriyanagi]
MLKSDSILLCVCCVFSKLWICCIRHKRVGTHKGDSGKRWDSDSSAILRSAEEEVDDEECLGQVPDSSWAVPQIPSPPTASGLYWPKSIHYPDAAILVPDICGSAVQKPSSLSASWNCFQMAGATLELSMSSSWMSRSLMPCFQ